MLLYIYKKNGEKTATFLPFCQILYRRTCPRDLEVAAKFTGIDSQVLATTLEPFQTIFADFINRMIKIFVENSKNELNGVQNS